MTNLQGERFKLSAWSDALGKETTLAKYFVYPNGLVYIDPDPAYYNYFKNLGLQMKGQQFELDMHNHPVGTVAKAVGIHYDDGGVRNQIGSMVETQISGSKVFALALEGISGQMGKLVSLEVESKKYKAIPVDSTLRNQGRVDFDSLYSEGSYQYQGMNFRDVLVQDGESLYHAYAVSLEDPSEGNDRLAIYAGAMNAMNQRKGIRADKVFGIKLTTEGQPVLICHDASRKWIPVKDVVSIGGHNRKFLKIEKKDFDARLNVIPGVGEARLINQSGFSHYLEAKSVKNLIQRTHGMVMNDPMVVADQVVSGRIQIPDGTDMNSLMESSIKDFRSADDTVLREMRIAAKDTSAKNALTQRVEEIIGDVISSSRMYLSEIDNLVENAQIEKGAEQEIQTRRVREYDVSELSL